ncbi:MAG: DUF418 domain-containing protein [Pseudomonadota bacterium]
MADRALMPDYLRLMALFGIVVVNVQFMAFPSPNGFASATVQTSADEIATWLVGGLFTLKTYGLFSFMFGVGLAFQIRSAERRSLPFGRLYRNRMVGLAILGLLHGCLFFPGDILVVYAITGSVLYFWRDWQVAKLVRFGAGLLVAQLVVAAVLLAFVPDQPAELVDLEREIMTEGSWLETVTFRSITFAILMPFLLVFQGLSALGWFCLGLASVKSGLIDRPDHPLWQRARRFFLIPGILFGLAASAILVWYDKMLGDVLIILFAPLATIGYLGLIAAIAKPAGPLMEKVLRAGGSSLTIYLGQSLILSTVFAAYGLGAWDAVGPAMAVIIAVATTILLGLFVMLWRTGFSLGPFEWVLRSITRFGVARP